MDSDAMSDKDGMAGKREVEEGGESSRESRVESRPRSRSRSRLELGSRLGSPSKLKARDGWD